MKSKYLYIVATCILVTLGIASLYQYSRVFIPAQVVKKALKNQGCSKIIITHSYPSWSVSKLARVRGRGFDIIATRDGKMLVTYAFYSFSKGEVRFFEDPPSGR
jgi:hypothetical protein